MAGMGPPPKNPKLRQRRNRTSTAATLIIPAEQPQPAAAPPQLPARGPGEVPWHPDTIAFWSEVWTSPVAGEYIAVDVPGLVLLARLIDRFNYGDASLAAEIRLQRACFGLSPLDRRRLQWETEKVSEAERRRARAGGTAPPSTHVRDPRLTLRVVKRAHRSPDDRRPGEHTKKAPDAGDNGA